MKKDCKTKYISKIQYRSEIKPGSKFNRFTYIKELPRRKKVRWAIFKCHCGNLVERSLHGVLIGTTKSCGCLPPGQTKHGESGSKIYNVWAGVKDRCFNPNNTAFKNYGDRGISMQPSWVDNYELFRDYVISLPFYNPNKIGIGINKFTLDRIDNNGNYEEGNLRWATPTQQANNKRNNRNK